MATLQYKSSLGRYRRYLLTMQNQPLLKASLFLILSLVLIIILVLAALRPTLTTIARLAGQIKEQKALEQKLDAKISTLKEAQAQLAAASSRLVYLDEAIPDAASISVWSDSMSRLASESGVVVTSIKLSNVPVGKIDNPASLPFQLVASGQYSQLKRYLQTLQNLRRLLKLEKITVATTAVSDTLVHLDVSGFLSASP